jgi:senataxin
VCIITPYKRQLKALQDALVCRCGPAVGNEVRVSTIDSFQGQEADVIILSLVRAAAPPPPAADGGPNPASLRASLGFVTDVRRMNVALTRARRALWVLGSASSLAASPEWSALLSDAHERGLVVQNSTAAALFPEHAARMTAEALTWESRSQAAGGRGPAGAGRGALPGLGPAMAMDSTGLGFAPPLRPAAPPMRQVLSGLTVHHTDRPPPVPIPARAAAGMEATQALNTVRRDLRSIEEVQEEIAAKRQRRDMGPR